MRIVLRVLNFNFRAASCCNVLVVNGGRGFEVFGFSSTFDTTQGPNFNSSTSALACDSLKAIKLFFVNSPLS